MMLKTDLKVLTCLYFRFDEQLFQLNYQNKLNNY